jgi:hypothetical protein
MKIYYYSIIVILSIIVYFGVISEKAPDTINGLSYIFLIVPSIAIFITFISTNSKANYKKIIGISFIKLSVTFEVLFAIGMVHYRGLDHYKYVMTFKGNLIEHAIFLIILLLIFLTISLPYIYFKKKLHK